MKQKGFRIMAIISILLSLFGCGNKPEPGVKGTDGLGKKAVDNESGLVDFTYSYNGSIGGDSYTFRVKKQKDGTALLTYYAMQYNSYGDMEMPVETDLLTALEDLYHKHHICQWEGFNKINEYVLDGSGFSLYLTFQDGKSMSASGSNTWPDGYLDYLTDLSTLIEPYLEAAREEARRKILERGMEGNLNSVIALFIQRGDSGSDKYDILLRRQSIYDPNIDVQILSESGEFLEPGKYRWYGSLPDEEVCFEQIRELIDKYDILQWYNFDEAAEDPNNKEWFQVSFGYDEDSINANGTRHPEHYDEFRKELLTCIIEMLQTAEQKHPELRSE